MKRLEFNNTSAQRIYDDYIKRLKRNSSKLSEEEKTDLLMEFNSHIYEGMQSDNNENELEKLIDVIEKLGVPEEILKPIVANKKLNQAVRTFNPLHIAQAISLNKKNGIIYGVFAVLYLFISVFILLIPLKLIFPKSTGLFYFEGEFHSFGFISGHEELTEVLGYWFIPLVTAFIVVLYIIITLLLRLKRKK